MGPSSPVSKGYSLELEGRTWLAPSGLSLKVSWRSEWISSAVTLIIDEPVLSTAGHVWNCTIHNVSALELKSVVDASVLNSSQLSGRSTSQVVKRLSQHSQKEAALIGLCPVSVSRGDNTRPTWQCLCFCLVIPNCQY